MQLKVYGVAIGGVKLVGDVARRIARADADLARQLRRACASVPLNIAEGESAGGGNRRARFDTARGSARETIACLEVAEALGYLSRGDIEAPVDAMHRVIATLVKLDRR